MAASVAFLFPGQGSQAVGMGRDLCATFPVAQQTFAEADEVLGYRLSQMCFEGPLDELTLTANTQPALLTLSTALARVLASELGLAPSWAAGHSLGEISALVTTAALGFADGVRLVHTRGRAMQEAVAPGVGSMAALMGLDLPTVEAVCREAAAGQVVSPANLNGAGQIVVAGHREAVERAVAMAKERGAKRAVLLAVSAPFHCALMQPAADRLHDVLQSIEVKPPRCPVVSNVEARPYSDSSQIKRLLVRQVVCPVRWEESVLELQRSGCRAAVEVGPGRVLTGLVKRIAADIQCESGLDLDAVRQLAEAA